MRINKLKEQYRELINFTKYIIFCIAAVGTYFSFIWFVASITLYLKNLGEWNWYSILSVIVFFTLMRLTWSREYE